MRTIYFNKDRTVTITKKPDRTYGIVYETNNIRNSFTVPADCQEFLTIMGISLEHRFWPLASFAERYSASKERSYSP